MKKPEQGPIIKYHNLKEDFSTYSEASFPSRVLAFLIDAAIIGLLQTALAGVIDYWLKNYAPPDLNILYLDIALLWINLIIIPSLYFIPQIKKDGQTIGKRILKIKIITENNKADMSIGRIFLREIIGKALSALFFGAGYLVRLFGLDTFHDKLAKTKVVSLKPVG